MDDISTSDNNAQLTQVPYRYTFSSNNDNLVYPQEEVISFTYSPPNELQVYEISYKEVPVSFDLVSQLLSNINNNYSGNLHEFHFIKYDEKKCYKVTCELIPHSLIVQYLNKNIHGIETKQNEQQEHVEFTRELKENLEYYLIQFLISK